MIKNIEKIKTIGDLKKSGYDEKSVKNELRLNLILKLKKMKIYFLISLVMMIQLFRKYKMPLCLNMILFCLVCVVRQKQKFYAV